MLKMLRLLLLLLLLPIQALAIPAFPGAQGGGATSTGGRGGGVIEVTSTADSGTGSLRACVNATGPRTCVFRVGGTINLASMLKPTSGNLTIAGQTAPGGGIAIIGPNMAQHMMVINTPHTTIRYIRIRKGFNQPCADSASTECGALVVVGGTSTLGPMIFDHLSGSWNQDEGFALGPAPPAPMVGVTFSNILHAEPLAGHPTSLFAGSCCNPERVVNIDFHHILAMNTSHRVPLFKAGSGRLVNNLFYNACCNQYFTHITGAGQLDIIGTRFRQGPMGPASSRFEIGGLATSSGGGAGPPGNPSLYLQGNIGWHQSNPAGDQWLMAAVIVGGENSPETGGPIPSGWRRGSPLPATTHPIIAEPVTSLEATLLPHVGSSRRLDCNGNWVMVRDSFDTTMINQYTNNTGITSLVQNEGQAGGFPTIANGTPCADADHDGMPDVWENANGLNPNNASDRNGVQASGYTNLEVYINGPAEVTTAPAVTVTAPANGATVSGSAVTVSANASDDVAVLGVQFKLDGSNLGAEDTTFPYSVSWNSTTASDGAHTLTAVARDADTPTTTSAVVNVTVNNAAPDGTSPTVSITAPSNGATVSGASVTVSATASDAVGVVGVQFKLDGVSGQNIGLEDTTAPYSVTWNSTTATNGSHTLTAIARDAAGNSANTSISVTTNNTAPTTITIGETNLLTVNDNGNGNLLLAQRNTLPQTATIQSISFYITTASGNLRMGLYDSTGPSGNPGAKVAETASITPVVGWNTVNVNTPVSLAAGNYWIAYLPSSSGLGFLAENTGGITRQYPFTYAPLPTTFSTTPNNSVWRWSLYATFTLPTGDTTPPTVSLTAPSNAETLAGPATVSATASDAGGIAGVQFKLDGSNLGAEDTSSPYSMTWQTTTSTLGPHTITAVARDTGNNVTTSSQRTVNVNNVDICP